MKHSMATLALLACGYMGSAHALDCSHSLLNHDEKRLLGGSENLCQSYIGWCPFCACPPPRRHNTRERQRVTIASRSCAG